MAVTIPKFPSITALIIVDMQEDFCSYNGSLAIPNASEIIRIINKILDLPFAIKVASKDWHPTSHISFACNHVGKVPYTDTVNTKNISKAEEKKIRLWPKHCVAGTLGAEFISELQASKIDMVIEKGTEENVEMYSVFYDVWGKDSGLSMILRELKVTDVWIVGVAFDYCVKETAIHSIQEGFNTVVLREATMATSPENWSLAEEELKNSGVKVLSIDDDDVHRVLAGSHLSF
ncbi:Nicotinamidase [Erysiphe necator]|nr:Nicotinamidase [Erysiphe necator]